MKHASLSLDYFALAKEAKALKTEETAKVVRIALLADCATQHLASIMRAVQCWAASAGVMHAQSARAKPADNVTLVVYDLRLCVCRVGVRPEFPPALAHGGGAWASLAAPGRTARGPPESRAAAALRAADAASRPCDTRAPGAATA